jgi:hypothetical protein
MPLRPVSPRRVETLAESTTQPDAESHPLAGAGRGEAGYPERARAYRAQEGRLLPRAPLRPGVEAPPTRIVSMGSGELPVATGLNPRRVERRQSYPALRSPMVIPGETFSQQQMAEMAAGGLSLNPLAHQHPQTVWSHELLSAQLPGIAADNAHTALELRATNPAGTAMTMNVIDRLTRHYAGQFPMPPEALEHGRDMGRRAAVARGRRISQQGARALSAFGLRRCLNVGIKRGVVAAAEYGASGWLEEVMPLLQAHTGLTPFAFSSACRMARQALRRACESAYVHVGAQALEVGFDAIPPPLDGTTEAEWEEVASDAVMQATLATVHEASMIALRSAVCTGVERVLNRHALTPVFDEPVAPGSPIEAPSTRRSD